MKISLCVCCSQHEYQDSQANFNKDSTVLTTCNKESPAAFNPDKFQPVELKAEEVSTSRRRL